MNFIIMLMALSFASSGEKSNCQDLIGTCEYYHCKNQELTCKTDNYFYEYGYKNCQALTEPNFLEKLSPLARDWLSLAKVLLQEETERFLSKEAIIGRTSLAKQKLEDLSPRQCKEIYKKSYAIHSYCYYEAGFCELGIKDRFQILNKLKSEVFSWRSWQEYLQLRWGCLRGEPLSTEEIELYSRLSEPPKWLRKQEID